MELGTFAWEAPLFGCQMESWRKGGPFHLYFLDGAWESDIGVIELREPSGAGVRGFVRFDAEVVQ